MPDGFCAQFHCHSDAPPQAAGLGVGLWKVVEGDGLRVRRVPVDALVRCRAVLQRSVRAEVPEARLGTGDRERRERLLEARVRIASRLLAGRRGAGTVVEQHPDRGKLLERGQGGLVGRFLLDRIERESVQIGVRKPHRLLVDVRRGGSDQRLVDDRRRWRGGWSYQRSNVSGSSESTCAPLVNVNHFSLVPVKC